LNVAARRLVIRGSVQGVGYRAAAVQVACELGVHGWVRNTRDGAVEALAQGEHEAIARFVSWCRRGPPLARVTEVMLSDAEVDNRLSVFETRATV
jgi:acylphosphatase